MKINYYSLEEIKTKFKNYRELKESNITDEEYETFCGGIMVLPKEIVDKVQNEIYFVLMSAHPKKGNPACYVNLKKGIDKGKEAIIVLTPFIFAPFVHENGKVIEPEQVNILHEIAHHVFGHYEYKDQQDCEEKEKAAGEQVEKWVDQWADFMANG
jgi:hypothetical protein